MQQFRFVVIGSLAAGSYFTILYLLLNLGVAAALAAFVSHGVAFIFAYFGQKKVAFRSTSKHNVSFPRYALLQFVCATAAAAAAATAESLGFIEPFMVALLTTTILGLTTYIASSKWVFRE